jgi:short-subunit dehydrogenase
MHQCPLLQESRRMAAERPFTTGLVRLPNLARWKIVFNLTWSYPSMTTIRGSAAALTGAASGIGRALALELAARGCDLALADRDEAGLQAVAAEIKRQHPPKVTVHRVDVAEPAEIEAFAQAAVAAHPGLNIVINNAGVALLGQFHEIDQAQMEWLININFWGVVRGTRAFLPHLATRPEAHIVNLSSIFGIVAPPGQTAYSAAKFAVRGFSESLRHELQMAKSPVRLSVVHPGGIATNIARNSRTGTGMTDNARRAQSIERFDAVAKTTPAAAALRIIQGIEKNQPRILIGNDARFMDLLQRFRPATYWAVIARKIEKMAPTGK